MKKKPEKLLDMQCKKCGKVTHHYLHVNGEVGEYRCVRCQSINKTIKVKPEVKIVFEMDAEFEAELNPGQVDPFKDVLNDPNVASEQILDDKGNPV